jgi:hypothetical protein
MWCLAVIIGSPWPVAHVKIGQVLSLSLLQQDKPQRCAIERNTIKQTATATAKQHTREQVPTASDNYCNSDNASGYQQQRAGAGDHMRERWRQHNNSGAPLTAQTTVEEIWYVSRTFGTPPVNKDGGWVHDGRLQTIQILSNDYKKLGLSDQMQYCRIKQASQRDSIVRVGEWVSTEQWGAKYQLDESYTTKGAGKCGGLLELKGCGDNRGQSVGVAIRDAIERVC